MYLKKLKVHTKLRRKIQESTNIKFIIYKTIINDQLKYL
jgi:hypothetical protein